MAFSPEYSPRCLQVLNRRCPVPVNHTNIFRLSSFTLHVNNSRISTGISLVDSSFDSLLQSKEITYNPGKYIPLKYMYSLVDPQYAKQHLMYPQTIFRTYGSFSIPLDFINLSWAPTSLLPGFPHLPLLLPVLTIKCIFFTLFSPSL